MATTFNVRIQALEKKLDEYQTRLDLEEMRRNILEKWIHLNFDFDVSSELEITENQNNRRSHVKRENRNRIKRKSKLMSQDFDAHATATSDTGAEGPNLNENQIRLVVDPAFAHDDQDIGGDSETFIPVSGESESEDSGSDYGVKKIPKIRKRKGQGNRKRWMSAEGTSFVNHDFNIPPHLRPHFRYLKTIEPSPGSQELPQTEGQCLVPTCGRVFKIRGKNFFNWRRHVQDVHDVKLLPLVVSGTPKQGQTRKCKKSTSRTGTQNPNPTDLLNSALKSIGVETIEASDQNNSKASVNVRVTHFPRAQDSSGQTQNSRVDEYDSDDQEFEVN